MTKGKQPKAGFLALSERGHFEHITINKYLMRLMAHNHPQEVALTVKGNRMAGHRLVQYLDSLPRYTSWISDCPNPTGWGDCGCVKGATCPR